MSFAFEDLVQLVDRVCLGFRFIVRFSYFLQDVFGDLEGRPHGRAQGHAPDVLALGRRRPGVEDGLR